MTKLFRSCVLSAVFISLLSLTVTAVWAGEIKGTVSVAGTSSAKNVAVWIGAIPGKNFAPPAKHAVVNQHHLEFVPHVLVILKGTTVDFLNSDPTLHNVYWPWISGNKKLARNLGTRPEGKTVSFAYDNLGIVPLLCNVHPEMSGYVVVVSTPYFAVTGSGGSFAIKGVPPGHYTLKGWSEKLGFRKVHSQPVQVGAGVTTVNLNLQ